MFVEFYVLVVKLLMLVMLHKQRFTVLLFVSFCLMSVMSLFLVLLTEMTYNIMISTSNVASCDMYVSLLFDKTSLMFSSVVTLISTCVFMFSRQYMNKDLYYWRFTWVLLLFVLSMNILIFSGSLFVLLIGWDGLGVTSFLLIIYYQSNNSWQAGFLTLMINRFGDVLIMGTVFYMTLIGNTLLFNYPTSNYCLMLGLFSVAALTKSAQYPFSAWLPAAMAAPTPVSALVHSSTLVTAGVYIIIRLMTTLDFPLYMLQLFLFCGSVTSFIGGVCAIFENDIKKIIAFSTLSQLGVMMFCLGLNSHTLALLHLFTHAMFKALLFLAAGCMLMVSYGVQDIRLLGSITKNYPLILVFFNMSTFCLMGLPFLSAFYSKHAIINLMWSSPLNLICLFIMLLAISMTSVYMLRTSKIINWANNSNYIMENTKSLSVILYLPLVILFISSLSVGWLMNILDLSCMNYYVLPSIYDMLLILLVYGAAVFGVFWTKRHTIKTISNMFLMWPFWVLINVTTNNLSKQVHQMEIGWMEPQNILKPFSNYLSILNKTQRWPIKSFSGLHPVVFLVVIMLYWYY
uniref:NADH-ubiquinone oxidoreductase chain 5 n=1 Tax=Camaenella platyodon TaxID=2566149 RepID=A0A4D6SYR5_9EUPU|nr:NADH dehydrogenase subunit 5 [Camaenella platyodon]